MRARIAAIATTMNDKPRHAGLAGLGRCDYICLTYSVRLGYAPAEIEETDLSGANNRHL